MKTSSHALPKKSPALPKKIQALKQFFPALKIFFQALKNFFQALEKYFQALEKKISDVGIFLKKHAVALRRRAGAAGGSAVPATPFGGRWRMRGVTVGRHGVKM